MGKNIDKRTTVANKRTYVRVGHLSCAIAKKVGVTSGDIMIDDHTLAHIFKSHRRQLEDLGVTPLVFIEMTIKSFNQIYQGHDNRLLLTCKSGEDHQKTIVISLLLRNKSFWEVVTGGPWRTEFFKNKTPLYEKKRQA